MTELVNIVDDIVSRMSSWDCANAMNGDTGTIEFLAMAVLGRDTTKIPVPDSEECSLMSEIVSDVLTRLESDRFDISPFAEQFETVCESARYVRNFAEDADESFTKNAVLSNLQGLIAECRYLEALAKRLIESIES